jgi:hypothetical protein
MAGSEHDAGDMLDAAPEAGSSDAAGCTGEVDASDTDCGKLKLDGLLNQCAQVDSYLMTPTSALVGEEVYLAAYAYDLEDDAISFKWSAPAGTFSQAEWPVTYYRCDATGDQIITLMVSDNPGCVSIEEIPVTCVTP